MIIVKNVPALVCRQCGEVYFIDEVMENLENIADKLESIIKEVAIVDYSDNVA
ncbi:MAG: YgiT-type zinc finger protein [Defluviitaleaceae bacterium]|nr:YgiT-type zinc finger protein [Defluviitaleaceae bacterium]